MYQVWSNFLNPGQIAMLGIVVTFLLTFLALKHPFSFLPSDHGREFAVNGGLSRGKLRGVGLVIVICFLIGSVLFLPLGAEYVIYAILLVCIMLSGYLDDASETPWSDYKKGAIDLVISIVTVITFVNYNSTTIYFGSMSLTIPKVIYIILGIILIFNVALSAATLPIFLGFWLMLRAFGAIGLGSDMGAMQIAGSGWTIFSGILLLLCSLWILFQPLVFGTTAVIVWVGISLLFAGVAACSLSLQLHRAHRCLGDR